MPLATDHPAMTSIMVTTSTPSQAKMCKDGDCLAHFVPNLTHIPPQWTKTGQKIIGTGKQRREENREAKKRRGDEAETRKRKENVRSKLLPTRAHVCTQS